MAHLFIKRQSRNRNKPPGIVLLAVLWMIVLITMIVVLYSELGQKKIREKAIANNPDEMRVAAYSALEISLAVIREYGEVDGAIRGPQQGWGTPLAYSGIIISENLEINVIFTDETSKIPLLSEDPTMLTKVFESMEIDVIDAQVLIQSLADWMDEDDAARPSGAEESYYEFEDPVVLPPNRRITDYDDFKYIRGFDEYFFDEETGEANELFVTFMATTSLYHDLPVNVNTTSTCVLDAMYDVYPPGLDCIMYEIEGADGELGTEDDEFSGTAVSGVDKMLGNTVGMLKILIEVRKGDAVFTLTALIQMEGTSSPQRSSTRRRSNETRSSQNQDYPFTILKLIENENLI